MMIPLIPAGKATVGIEARMILICALHHSKMPFTKVQLLLHEVVKR